MLALLDQADDRDRLDGALAYRTYNDVIRSFAAHYGATFERALSAFVALSPNSDYFGNLRSLASVLAGVRDGVPCECVTVSTYKHCRDRAYSYVTGERLFLASAKGPKVRSFFLNIFDPFDPDPVTVDGHMVSAWRGRNMVMKEAAVRLPEYMIIARGVRDIARIEGMVPNQMQATLWMTRKRIQRIKFAAQLDLFSNPIAISPDDALPYPNKRA